MQQPPIFDGFDTLSKPVDKFLAELQRYFVINNIATARWPFILDTLIEEPALTAYETAIATNVIRADVPNLADGDLAQELRDRYNARTKWLEDTYHDQDHQDLAKDILEGMYQGINESPQLFYGRIATQIKRARYDAAVATIVAKQIFMKGIHQEIRTKISEQPRLDLPQTVNLANRIWQNAHQSLNQNVTLFQQQKEQERDYRLDTRKPEIQTYVPPRSRRTENQQLKTRIPTKEDYETKIDELTNSFKKLQAQVNDRQGFNQQHGPPTQYFGNQRQSYRQNQWNDNRNQDHRRNDRYNGPPRQDYRNNQRDQPQNGPTCWKCGEMGHYSRECQAENNAYAAPPNNTNATVQRQVNTVTFDDNYQRNAYPAIVKNQLDEADKIRTRPYQRKSTMRKEPQNFKTTEPMDTTETMPQSESPREMKILKKLPREKKTLDFDPWQTLQNQPAHFTWGEVLKASPMARAMITEGVKSTKDGVVPKPVNQASKKQNPTTSAYASGHIGRHPFIGIIDTGAGPSILSKTFIDKLGWKIQTPTETTIIIADGSSVSPLGIIKDVPITFGEVTITIDMEVVETESYDLLIGNDWLQKANAMINLKQAYMMIQDKGVKAKVMIDLGRGPKVQTVEEEEYLEEAGFFEDDEEDLTPVFHVKEVQQFDSDEDYPDFDCQKKEDSTQRSVFATITEWKKFASEESGSTDQEWDEEKEYQKSETPSWKVDTSDWQRIESPTTDQEMGWEEYGEEVNWGNTTSPEWYEEREVWDSKELLTISIDNTPQSPRLQRYTENLRRQRCPHGIRFYSPETDCPSCNAETAEYDTPITHQVIHIGEECEHGTYFRDQETKCTRCINLNIQNEIRTPYEWSPMDELRLRDYDFSWEKHPNLNVNRHRVVVVDSHIIRHFCKNRPQILTNSIYQQHLFDHRNHDNLFDRIWDRENYGYATTPEEQQVTERTKQRLLQQALKDFNNYPITQHRTRHIKQKKQVDHGRPIYKKHQTEQLVMTLNRASKAPIKHLGTDEIDIKVMKLDPRAIIHQQKHEGDAGFDLSTLNKLEIPPHETAIMDTGLRFAIPKGYFGLIKDKSGLATAGLRVSGGVIDQNYTGRIKVILTNLSKIQKFRILEGE